MDLPRAKTILIIAFLILNSFLGYQIWQQSQPANARIVPGEVREEKDLLAYLYKSGIDVQTEIPEASKELALLQLSFSDLVDPLWWVQLFFPDEQNLIPQVKVYKEGPILQLEYFVNDAYLSVSTNGHIHYRNPFPDEVSYSNEELFVEEFIERHGGLPINAILTQKITNQSESIYVYNQQYKDSIVFASEIRVTLRDGQVVEYERVWFDVIGYTGQKRTSFPIDALLWSIVFAKEPLFAEPKQLIDISLGYYSLPYDSTRFEATPVWRFLFKDGTTVYYNVVNGQLEETRLELKTED